MRLNALGPAAARLFSDLRIPTSCG